MPRRLVTSAIALGLCAALAHGEEAVKHLQPLPAGIWLPVSLRQTLDARNAHPGQTVTAQLIQRVPLPASRFLPAKARLLGRVVSVSPQSIALEFDRLELHGQTEPVHLKLLAWAQWMDVDATHDPLGATDRSTADPSEWTTRQVGGDEVYRTNWYGPVDNQYSEKVGDAGPNGVYAAPSHPGGLPLALGPFSTDVRGVYGTSDLQIASDGSSGGPIRINLTGPHAKLHRADALLLEITR